jgi:hypothetical protein
MDEATGRLVVEMAGPVPNDIQHLAYEAFDVAARRVDAKAVSRGLDQAVAHEASTYAEVFATRPPGNAGCSSSSRQVRDPVFSAAFARSVGLAGSNSVKRALDALETDELVARHGKGPAVADPFFAAWLRPAGGPEPAR